MRTIAIATIIVFILAATFLHAEETESYVDVTNEAPYPVIAEVFQRAIGMVAKATVLPGDVARISLPAGNYILSVRPVMPFYFVGLSPTPQVLLRNPYIIVPLSLEPGETYSFTYTLGNLTQAGAGLVVLKSVLDISVFIVDDSTIVTAGKFSARGRIYAGAIFMVSEGNHTFFAVFNQEEPILCLMKYRLQLGIKAGDELVIDIPQNLGKYVVPINMTNELGEPVDVEVIALSSNTVTETYSRTGESIAYMLTRQITVPANSSVVIDACFGRYWIRAWGMNSPRNITLETRLNITDSSQKVVITVPDSMGGGALTIRPGECVAAINISGEGISMGLRREDNITLLLPPGEYLVTAELGKCGIINAPEYFVAEASVGLGDDLVVEAPPSPARLAIGNGVDYELVVSIVNSTGCLVHAITLPPTSSSVLEVWPGNYTVIANPFTRPDYYVGPLSGLRWEAKVSLGWGDETFIDARPSASYVLEVVGPPGAEVFLEWGTSSARYLIPPDGVLRLSAAPATYSISSCPGDVFHSCWSTTIDLSDKASVVVVYGLRPDTVAGTMIAIAAVAAAVYLVIRRRGWPRRTRRGVTEAPP